MQHTINETDKRIEFRTNYPTTGFEGNYDIEYVNPNNPMEFNTVDVVVGGITKASVSIPKTGDIKFFDKNDTQNYVIGDYDSPKYSTSTQVFDSLGKPYTVFLEFQKLKENQWAWRATEETGIPISYVDGNERTYTPSPNDLTSIVGGIVEFDSGGRVSALKAIRQNGMVEDDIDINRIKFDPGAVIDDGAAPPPEEGATAVNAGIDFSELVQFSSEFSTSVTYQNGNSMGVLQNFAINQMGEVMGTFSNGKSDVLGQIALAIFNNPSGLNEVGNTLYQVSANSGVAQVGLAGSGGRATVSPGVLEMSNVDLAEEFTGMVIVQRAFQANARTVTTVDQILQELVNLKR
jgi:flagellar hook protein FlgE